jgi:hypothetical protein
MKAANRMKSLLTLFLFLFLATPAGLAFAHTQDGSLGSAAAATDYYSVLCSDDGNGPAGSLLLQVQNVSVGAPTVAVVANKGTLATSSSDPVNADGSPGPLVSVSGGDGSYNVFVFKSEIGVANYILDFHCMTGPDGGGLHTGTEIVTRQRGAPPGAAPAGLALAHTQDGSLGAPSIATDYYHVTCSNDGRGAPQSLVFQIQNRGSLAAPVIVLAHRGNAAMPSADLVAGDGGYSPLAFVNGGEGEYNVFVIKTADGGSNYTLGYDCMTGNSGGGVPTGTTLVRADGAVSDSVPLIEYYHAGFDHYFITAIADEIQKLDNGTFVGWARTGLSFNVFASGASSAAVCRFFSTAFDPKSSHFYTPFASECATVKTNPNWQFEGEVFNVDLPVAGECAANRRPLYRLYNDGQGDAPNHRYTTDLAVRAQMMGLGWIPEGDGIGVIACVPM